MIRLRCPCPGAPITQGWGEHPEWYRVWGLAGHNGIDLGVPIGTPVHAAHDGAVIHGELGGPYGMYCDVKHYDVDRYYTRYGHLSAIVVPYGAGVVEGDVIALSGNSGNVHNGDGAHLHLGLSIAGVVVPGYGQWCDPTPYLQEEQKPMQKLSLHVQQPVPWVSGVIAASPNRFAHQFYHGPDEEDLFPTKWTIARIGDGDDDKEAFYYRQGADGADAYFDLMFRIGYYRGLRGKAYAIESPNEPAVKTPEACMALATFTARLRLRMGAIGWCMVAGNFSNGTPDVTDGQVMRLLEPVWRCPFLGLHQYAHSSPVTADNAEWLLYRHRKVVAWLKAEGIPVPHIWLTEFGLDGTGTERGAVGWQMLCAGGFDEYLAEMRKADAELQKDAEVQAAFLFNVGGTERWASFEHNEYEARRIVAGT